MQSKIRIKAGEKIADANQAYESLVIVVSKALGGKGSSAQAKADPKTMPQSADALEATLRRHMGGR